MLPFLVPPPSTLNFRTCDSLQLILVEPDLCGVGRVLCDVVACCATDDSIKRVRGDSPVPGLGWSVNLAPGEVLPPEVKVQGPDSEGRDIFYW
jgi:hypothetical protein